MPKGGLLAEQQNAGAGHARISTLGPVLHSEVAPNPLFGEGFGTRITVPSPTTRVPNAPITDDQWLATLAETGIAGVLTLGWLFVRFLRSMRRAARTDQTARGSFLTAAAAIVTSYGVGLLTYDAFSFIQVTFIFFIVLALGAAAVNVSPEDWQSSSAAPVGADRRRPGLPVLRSQPESPV
jgi:O-antigen ligase